MLHVTISVEISGHHKTLIRLLGKEIGDEEPYYSTKISIISFIWAGLAYTKQAQYKEGCAKLNYSLPEV